MKIFYQTVMLAAVLCVSSAVQAEDIPSFRQQGAITLRAAVEKAVTTNPEVQTRYHNYLFAVQDKKIAFGALLPKADITSTYRRQENIGSNFGNTAIPERQTELVIRQLLFDGFATSGEVKRLDYATRVRYYEMLSTMQNIALETVRAYIDIQRYRQLAVYAQDNYVTHKQLFDLIKERVDAGVGRRVDLEQAKGRMALAEANLLTETTNLHDVISRYQRLVGELPPDNLEPVDFYKAGVETTPMEALQLAYRQNPDLLSTIENIVATRQEVKNREGRYYPRLDLQARKTLDVSRDGANSIQAQDTIELTLSFNLFNGFSDRALINQTVEKLNSSQDQRDKACVDTRQLVVIAYNDISQLTEQLIYRDQHRDSIEKAREAYRKQFDIGQRTLLDLLDTENEYFQARRTYSITEYDLYTAFARTYAGQGELLNKLGVVRSDLPEIGREAYLDSENICQPVAPSLPLIDKPAIVAQAKPLNDTLRSLVNRAAAQAKPVAPITDAKSGAAAPPSAAETPADAVSLRVHAWASAWEQKNFDAYISFYADKFVPEKGLSRNAWVQQRKQRLAKPTQISVILSNIKVNADGDKATAEFMQQYSVPGHSDSLTKELQFERMDNRWMIVRETVKTP